MPKDLSDMLENDAQTVRNVTTGGNSFSIPKAIEGTLWALAILFVIGMILAMPWVGPDEPIAGELWLGVSLFGICAFGALAILVRFLESESASAYDKHLDERFNGR